MNSCDGWGGPFVLGWACVLEGFKLSKDGKAPWVYFPGKLLVTLVREGTDSYDEGIELEVEWLFR